MVNVSLLYMKKNYAVSKYFEGISIMTENDYNLTYFYNEIDINTLISIYVIFTFCFIVSTFQYFPNQNFSKFNFTTFTKTITN